MIKYILIFTVTFSFANSALVGTICACAEVQNANDCSHQEGCTWSSVTSQCLKTACSLYTYESICDADPGCAWTNTGVCADFTTCSAYTISTSANASNCYAKDLTCIPGTVNSDGTVPCITGTVTCSTFKTMDTCFGVQSDGQRCYFNDTSCIPVNITSCSTITDKVACNDMGCTYSNAGCGESLCSSVLSQDKCTAVQANASNQYNICIWSNGACIDATDVSILNSSTCQSSTSSTYTWNGQTCKACTGQSTQLIGSYCDCTELLNEGDCSIDLSCSWNTTNSKCTMIPCSTQLKQEDCDNVVGCAWTNDDKCLKFTKCSDYSIKSSVNATQCYRKHITCIPGSPKSDGTVPCISGSVNCTNIKDKTLCTGLVQENLDICYFDGQSCIEQNVLHCSTITNSKLCEEVDCIYTNSTCTAPSCNTFESEAECTSVRDDSIIGQQICYWLNQACTSAVDVNSLNATNCYSYTGGTYTWSETYCKACTGWVQTSTVYFSQTFIIFISLLIITFM